MIYYRDLYRFGFSLTGSEADAADLTQETFYIWADKGDQLNNPRSVKGWLFTTLHREFLKICRRRKRFADEPIEESTYDLADVPVDCVEPHRLANAGSHASGDRRRFPRASGTCITWRISLTNRLQTCWRFRSGLCSRELRAQKFSYCVG